MGLFGLIFDTMLLSAGAAGVRRLTGYSAKEYVMQYVSNPMAKGALSAFFGAGEAITFTVLKYGDMLRTNREAALKRNELTEEIDSKNSSGKH